MRRLHFVPLAMLLLLSAPHYAAANPIYVGSVADPLGDTFGPVPDIVFAGIVVDDSWITFTMKFAPGDFVPATTRSVFALDTDQNSATGALWNGLGVDFQVNQGYLGATGTASLTQSPGGLLASAPVTFLADGVQYAFARSLFGGEDGALNFIAAVQVAIDAGSSSVIGDFAPNIERGAGPASTAAAVPEPATLGLLAGGLSLLSAYRNRGGRRIPKA